MFSSLLGDKKNIIFSCRLLDEFGDGLGVAQAVSYVDPQFLTYMALEERLAQAMEVSFKIE